MESEIRLSVVICTKNRPEKLIECIGALSKQIKKPYEVVIIDSSDKNYSSLLKKFNIKINYVFKNLTMTQARNFGIDISKGCVILFLDDDALLEKEYIKNISLFYSSKWSDEKIAGAEGLIINDKDKRFFQRIAHFPSIPNPNQPYTVRILHGCNMSFRRSVLENYRFDENTFGYYADDDDICSRISKRFRLYFVPSAKVIHNHTSSGGARTEDFKNFNTFVYNKFYIFLKSKSLRHLSSLLFSYTTTFFRVFIFYKGRKSRAIKGMFYGATRIIKSVFKNDFEYEIRRIR